ncbi:hypothetical protein [uncultured Parasutterella sp.]|uniref:hypothetical protein n=1 Tax=uncultured Parasutterella sp. TaxID=1263098 RepID=UPI002593BAA3|nr:hypothetical protein [uncultured Parasutterella sp.]
MTSGKKNIFTLAASFFFIGTSFSSPSDIAISYDLNSRQIIESKDAYTVKSISGSIPQKIYIASKLLKKIQRKELDIQKAFKVDPSIFSNLDKNTPVFFQQGESITLKELIASMLLLQSDEAAILGLQLINTSDKKENPALNQIAFSENGFFVTLTELINGLQDIGISFFDSTVLLQDQELPSQIQTVRSGNSETVILRERNKKQSLAISFVKNSEYPENIRRVAVINFQEEPSTSVNQISRALLHAVNDFETAKIFPSGHKFSSIPVAGGIKNSVDVITPSDIFVTLSKEQIKQNKKEPIEIIIERKELIKAPVQATEAVGKVNILQAGKVVKSFSVYPGSDVGVDKSFLPLIFNTFQKVFKKRNG